MELLSVKIAAEGLLRQWPDAAYLQMDYSDQRYGHWCRPRCSMRTARCSTTTWSCGDELDNDADDPPSSATCPTTAGTGRPTGRSATASRVWTLESSCDDDEGDRVEHRRPGVQPLRLTSGGVGATEGSRRALFCLRGGQNDCNQPNDHNCNF